MWGGVSGRSQSSSSHGTVLLQIAIASEMASDSYGVPSAANAKAGVAEACCVRRRWSRRTGPAA